MSCENCEESAYVIDKLAKPLTRYSMESYIQGWHERHEMAPDPDGQWYAKAEADARIAALEAEVERLRSKQEEDRLRRLSRFLIPKTTFVSENGD